MSEAKHTPGPWCAKHREGADGMYRTEVYSEQHGGIATCEWTPKNCGNGVTATYREANARLIAAAPELLAFAQEFLADYQSEDGMGSMKYYANLARVAIAKATGSSEATE
jgi:hypothetical protein